MVNQEGAATVHDHRYSRQPASLIHSTDVLHHRTRRRSLVKLRRRFGLHLSRNFLDQEVDLIVLGCGFIDLC